MKIFVKSKLTESEYKNLFKRKGIKPKSVENVVKKILSEIKKNGDEAVRYFTEKFEGERKEELYVSQKEFLVAEKNLTKSEKNAINQAANNIEKFHIKQKPKSYSIETMPGIRCSRKYVPIDNAGLYIPGGTAPLPSTMLMLGIPASIAGVKRIAACTPAPNGKINDAVLYSAKICGVTEIYKTGGAQAIGMLAYGTRAVAKVDKIFGPGNQYVTTAKSLVSMDPEGAAIDMPAGPSEVLVIADNYADIEFISADLLSQAEHGDDSSAVLVTNSHEIANEVILELNKQKKMLNRKSKIENSLNNSFILVTDNIQDAIEFSNFYAPEHLIIQTKNAERLSKMITNAGSVFIGEFSPESAGDYASGTNHSLPTYGFAKSYGGVTVESFLKSMTFQKINLGGLKEISKTIIKLAEMESLQAHANAVKVRIKK